MPNVFAYPFLHGNQYAGRFILGTVTDKRTGMVTNISTSNLILKIRLFSQEIAK